MMTNVNVDGSPNRSYVKGPVAIGSMSSLPGHLHRLRRTVREYAVIFLDSRAIERIWKILSILLTLIESQPKLCKEARRRKIFINWVYPTSISVKWYLHMMWGSIYLQQNMTYYYLLLIVLLIIFICDLLAMVNFDIDLFSTYEMRTSLFGLIFIFVIFRWCFDC